MKRLLPKRVVCLLLLFLVALFLARPPAQLLRKRVAATLSTELDRPVGISSVHIRFLPRPGLELGDLVIHDSPQFGTEPLLRAPEVTAWLRVSSLLRRRIEISSLSLSEASLNLTRTSDGRWNLEELLERASRSSTAPTAARKKEPRRKFTYIEADHTRINFKNGVEKTRFALTNAEFALWQDSENQWGMRLRANPIRTDANLTDTGVINVSGSWGRSALLENTPIQLAFEWKQGQVGQVTRLLTGEDKEWRGSLFLSGAVSGTLGKLAVSSTITADQLRKDDIFADGNLRLVAHCAAEYDSAQRWLTNLDCGAPAGDGSIELKGSAAGSLFSAYDLTFLAKDVPAQSVVKMARQVDQRIPGDLRAAGDVNLTVSLKRADSSRSPVLTGKGEAQNLRLSSADKGTELALGDVPFHTIQPASTTATKLGVGAAFPEIQVGPVSVALGRPTPVRGELSFSRSGYNGSVRGEAGLKRLLTAAQTLHIPVPQVTAEGAATVNLELAHEWGSPAPVITGTAELHSVRAQVHGLNSPLQIRRAELTISRESVRVKNLEASVGTTAWRGSLLIPRPCSAPDSCAFEFRLQSPEVTAASLNLLLNPAAAKQPWYRVLGLGSSSSFFTKARASGSISIDRLNLGKAMCGGFFGKLDLADGKVSLNNVQGDVLGGEITGNVKVDFASRPPAYSGSGEFQGISLAAVADLTGNEWADGAASASYKFTAAGSNLEDALNSAELTANFDVADGSFPHVFLTEDSGPLHAIRFSGEVSLHQKTFSFQDSELDLASGAYNVSGTASVAGQLNLKITDENSAGYSLSGTLADTRVSPISNQPTQAALKP